MISAPRSRTDDIKKCDIPYHKTGKLLVFSGTILGGPAEKESENWPDSRLREYYRMLVKAGVNTERGLPYCKDDPYDPAEYWTFDDPEYLSVVEKRVKMIASYDLTLILNMTPYGPGGLYISDAQARWLIRGLAAHHKNIIWSPVNEPADNARQGQLVQLLLSEGVSKKHILVEFVESGEFGDMFGEEPGSLDPNHEMTISYHWAGSVETFEAVFSGSTAAMVLGWGNVCMSNDGQDKLRKARGLNFWLHEQNGITEYRRPNNQQLYDITKWLLSRNGRGYENLSAAAYQRSSLPNMDDMLSIGKLEAEAMRRAYDEIIGGEK